MNNPGTFAATRYSKVLQTPTVHWQTSNADGSMKYLQHSSSLNLRLALTPCRPSSLPCLLAPPVVRPIRLRLMSGGTSSSPLSPVKSKYQYISVHTLLSATARSLIITTIDCQAFISFHILVNEIFQFVHRATIFFADSSSSFRLLLAGTRDHTEFKPP